MNYLDLSQQFVDTLDGQETVEVAATILAERATVTGGGTILRWSEFNENPDPLVNELLARILLDQVDEASLRGMSWRQVIIFSIENSAAYLSTALSYVLAQRMKLVRPVRLVRARKIGAGSNQSPAMGAIQGSVSVTPITAGGEERQLMASVTNREFFEGIKLLLVVDDFRATGSTLMGGVNLARRMFGRDVTIIPMAALGKPEQEDHSVNVSDAVAPVVTALNVRFWPKDDGTAWMQVNGGKEYQLVRARAEDWRDKR